MPDNHHVAQTEPDTISYRPVLIIVFGFFIFVGLCIWGLLSFYYGSVGPRLYVAPRAFPAPELQTSALSDWESLQKAQTARIERYGWVDKSKGVLRVPIQRAMEIVASKGPQALEPLSQGSSNPSPATVSGEVIQGIGQSPQGSQQ